MQESWEESERIGESAGCWSSTGVVVAMVASASIASDCIQEIARKCDVEECMYVMLTPHDDRRNKNKVWCVFERETICVRKREKKY